MSELTPKVKFKDVLNVTVLVAALGYFVDVYDLVLFLIIGRESLIDLGIEKSMVLSEFQFLLNVQMIGMLLGGIFWGVLGDKKGRLSVLFGSILMYSVANLLNGMVGSFAPYTMEAYVILRFFAGLGLAGELGAGITLVAEILSKESRGYGTMIVASVGVCGAVVAALIASNFGWEFSYYLGGGLGLSLLILRIGVFESGIFKKLTESNVSKGNFLMLFTNKDRFMRYLHCILIGLPIWYIIGIMVGRAPEISKILQVKGEVVPATSVMVCYIGLIFGDIATGTLSQILRSRKKVIWIFYGVSILFISLYLSLYGLSLGMFYTIIFFLGFSVGFWAIFVTVASEHFGTNLRATVATTVPNFVRGSLVPISLAFDFVYRKLQNGPNAETALIDTFLVITPIILLISFWSLYNLKETFGKDLDYLEDNKLIAG
jgi:putative MFS transporter